MPATVARITKTAVDRIDPSAHKAGSVALWDNELKGFGVRVQPSGKKVFVLKTEFLGRDKQFTIGEFNSPLTAEEARRKTRDMRADCVHGIDPTRDKDALKYAITVAF